MSEIVRPRALLEREVSASTGRIMELNARIEALEEALRGLIEAVQYECGHNTGRYMNARLVEARAALDKDAK
jgi:hypothetical protein